MSNSPYDELTPHRDTPEPQESPMPAKPIIKSKTFWINLITIIAGIITTVGGSDMIQANPEYAGIAAAILGVVNIAMRFLTKEPVRSGIWPA